MESGPGDTERSDMKPCRYCASPMPSAATICPTCSTTQSPWRATALFVASIAGLLGVLGSAGTYIVTALPSVYRTVAWKDQIRVWDFEAGLYPSFGATISNNGDGPVLLAKLLLRFPRGGNAEYYIGKTLTPGETFSQKRELAPTHEYSGHIQNVTGEVPKHVWAGAQQGNVGPNSRNPCYVIVVYHKDSTALPRMTEHATFTKEKLVTRDDVEAQAIFYSLHHGQTNSVGFPWAPSPSRS